MKIYALHGWTTDRKDGVDPLAKWEEFLKGLRDQKIDIELLRVPGLTTDLDKVFDLDSYVEWLKQRIRESEKSENQKVILLGHSNGGRIVARFAAKYPDRVEKLILIDSAGIYSNALPIRLKRFVFRNLAKVGKAISKSEALKKLLYKIVRERDYKDATEAQRKTMVNMIQADLRETFKSLMLPTLIVWGENDQRTSLADGKLIHQLIEGSEFHVVKGARHSPMFTHTKEVIKIIDGFLKSETLLRGRSASD